MNHVTLDIFGLPITIQPKGCVITIEKTGEHYVTLKSQDQMGCFCSDPINVWERFDKLPDEFIAEFNKQNYIACDETIPFD